MLAIVATFVSAQTAPSNQPALRDQMFGGAVGEMLSQQIVATNATHYEITSGTLPDGLTLDSATGMVTGTPTAVDTTSAMIKVTNAYGVAEAGVTFAICEPAQGAPSFEVSDRESAYEWASNIPDHGGFAFNISNHPSSITATGVPPGASFDPNYTGPTYGLAHFSWEADAYTGGNFAVTITATNAVGSTSKTFHWIIHPGLDDFIRRDKSSYSVGDTITLTAPFSAPVNVTGTPYIPLWGTKRANYVSGSGTDQLTFQYVVVADDPSQSRYTVVHIELGDGTIATPDGVSVTNLTVASSIAGGPTPFDVVASGSSSAPVFSGIRDVESAFDASSSAMNTHHGYAFAVSNVTDRSQVTATGVPPGVQLAFVYADQPYFTWLNSDLVAGSYKVTVTAANSSGSDTQTFNWLVHPGIRDPLKADKATYTVGDIITIQAVFSSAVVVTGTPYIGLVGANSAIYARYAGGSGTNTLLFRLTVVAGDPVGNYTFTQVSLDGGTIGTADGISASLTSPSLVGSTPPTLSIAAGATPPPANDTPPPTPTKSDQTITFASPTGAVIVGQSTSLGATSSAGLPITYSVVSGDATLSGNVLTPTSTATLIVRASSGGDDTYNATSTDVNFGNPQPAVSGPSTKTGQQIALSVGTTDVPAEQPFTLSATASSGLPITYSVVSGPATASGNTITFTGTGNVTIRASQAGDATYAPVDTTVTVTAHPVTRLVNISSRVHVSGGSDGATVGFVVTGTTPKTMLIRAVGDSLAGFGVNDGLANPTLTLYGAHSTVIAANSGWADNADIAAAGSAVGAFALMPGKTDAALLVALLPGLYSAQVTAPNNGSVVLEVYDVAATAAVPTKQLINISTRAHIDGTNQVFQGFVISGDQPKRVLLRAVGATLQSFGVSDPVADPAITVYSGDAVIASNDNWGDEATGSAGVTLGGPADIASAAATVGAFALPSGSKDASLLITLQPGVYSAVVTAGDGQSGSVIVEAYEAP